MHGAKDEKNYKTEFIENYEKEYKIIWQRVQSHKMSQKRYNIRSTTILIHGGIDKVEPR